MKKTLLVLSLVLWTATAFAGDGNIRRSSARIPGSYIVVLHAGADLNDVAASVKSRGKGRVQREYRRGIKGIAVEMSDAEAQELASDPRVAYVEEDSVVEATAVPWGVDRIDQRSLPLDGSFNPDRNGSGVRVYVFDTGVSPHDEYSGRLLPGFNATGDRLGTSDCHGHGTHVAGIIAGKNYGVAEGAEIVPVRVLGCNGSGSVSALLAGIDFVISAQTNQPAVANMSLSGTASTAFDDAVNRLIDAGVTTVVAAGNAGSNACHASPARVLRALTVAATDQADSQTTWSNYGGCVDLFAPGAGIRSASNQSTTATTTRSGTSQAAPFVAGVAALWLEGPNGLSPDTVVASILASATPNVVTGLSDRETPSRLLSSLRVDAAMMMPVEQLISDPGFDDGPIFWTSEICTVINQTGCPPLFDDILGQSLPSRSDKTHATLGARSRDLLLVSAPITIPSNASSVELGFWLWVVTKERGNTADDVLKIDVRDAAGKVIEDLGTYSNLSESNTYRRRYFDMSAYRGKTIRVAFTSAPDHGKPTWFLLDDVELNARY